MLRLSQIFLLIAIGPNIWAAPEVRWSRQIYSSRLPVARESRQAPAGDWIPLTQPCLTCRPLINPADAGAKHDISGLTAPRPPVVTRQIHNNFFPQDESSILSAPPPPSFPSQHHTSVAPRFQEFIQQFNNPNHLQYPVQNFFPQSQQAQFLPQTYLNNPTLLLSNNPQLWPLLNNPNAIAQPQQQQQDKRIQKPAPEKLTQNVKLEQNKQIPDVTPPVPRLELPLPNPPTQFLPPQMIVLNPADSFLTPPPNVPNASVQNVEFPGLEKEEIQLLYVPVETLRQRGNFQQNQRPTQQAPPQQKVQQYYHTIPQNIQYQNQQVLQQPLASPEPVRLPPPQGHFITQAPQTPPPAPTKQQSVTPPTSIWQTMTVQRPTQQFTLSPQSQAQQQSQQFTLSPQSQSQQQSQQFTLSPQSQSQQQSQQFTLSPQSQVQSTFAPHQFSSFPPQFQTDSLVPLPIESQSSQPDLDFIRFTQKPITNLPFRGNELNEDKTISNHEQILLNNQKIQLKQQNPRINERPRFIPQTQPEIPITTPLPATTTLAPHQPPLSVFMNKEAGDVRVVDVLRELKGAHTIPVLDHFSENVPKVFVGPASLQAPNNFGKFDLPYLSNIENNRIERKVDRIPFFVAPLNFNPPNGYSKIPFPAPHIGSVVISSESAMKLSTLQTPATTPEYDQYSLSPSLPEVNPEIPELINHLELDTTTTTQLPETTSYRPRQRRPNNAYRPPGRRPVPNSRFRTTTSTTTTEAPEQEQTNLQLLKESTEKRFNNAYLKRNRNRSKAERRPVETTSEAPSTEPSFSESTIHSSPSTQSTQRSDVLAQNQPFDNENQFDENPFGFPANFDTFEDPIKEIQGIFEVQPQPQFQPSPQPQPQAQPQPQPQPQSQPQSESLSVVSNSNGDSGFYQPNPSNLPSSTDVPISSTQFFEHTNSYSSSTEPPKIEEVTEKQKELEANENLDDAQNFDSPRQNYRQNVPNVPGVKSVPNPSSVKVKSPIRSRPRGHLNFKASQSPRTTTRPADNQDETADTKEQESEVSKTSKHYFSSKRRTTTESSKETETRTNSYTLRPHRLSSTRTSVSTKRVRKPTTPTYETTSEETAYGRRSRPEYSPSGVSNDVLDEQVTQSSRPKSRKNYLLSRQKNVEIVDDVSPTTPTPVTTQSYVTRRGDDNVEDVKASDKFPEWNPSESGFDISGISLTTLQPSSAEDKSDQVEERKKNFDSKKAVDPELEKKNGRRRIRVRVHKRPHDNFEAAESQNVGTVANVLVPPTPAKPNTEPDLYLFAQNGDFTFDSAEQFIGTNNKDHVRNITSDILESTVSFSSPGLDNATEIQKPVIVNAEKLTTTTTTTTTTTELPDVTNFKTEDTTTELPESTTEFVDFTTEIPTTEIPTKVQHSKVIKTTTTTQISHETEICYKGKCIKTNAENPDKDLKLLVESANLEEKAKT